jgi:hypothetical protein
VNPPFAEQEISTVAQEKDRTNRFFLNPDDE